MLEHTAMYPFDVVKVRARGMLKEDEDEDADEDEDEDEGMGMGVGEKESGRCAAEKGEQAPLKQPWFLPNASLNGPQTRLQRVRPDPRGTYTGMAHCMSTMIRTEGSLSLFRGKHVPFFLRAVLKKQEGRLLLLQLHREVKGVCLRLCVFVCVYVCVCVCVCLYVCVFVCKERTAGCG